MQDQEQLHCCNWRSASAKADAMKSKKSAFANTSIGYGRHKHNGQSKGHGGHKTEGKSNKSKDGKEQLPREQKKEEQEKDLNSGFGDYLRTPEGL